MDLQAPPGCQVPGRLGRPDAEDVAYSLQRAADKDRYSFAGTCDGFESIVAVDPITVPLGEKFTRASARVLEHAKQQQFIDVLHHLKEGRITPL